MRWLSVGFLDLGSFSRCELVAHLVWTKSRGLNDSNLLTSAKGIPLVRGEEGVAGDEADNKKEVTNRRGADQRVVLRGQKGALSRICDTPVRKKNVLTTNCTVLLEWPTSRWNDLCDVIQSQIRKPLQGVDKQEIGIDKMKWQWRTTVQY